MQEIKQHLSFCVHYSIVYASNAYLRSKQDYFTHLLLIRTFFTRTRLKRLNSGFVSRRLLHSLESPSDVESPPLIREMLAKETVQETLARSVTGGKPLQVCVFDWIPAFAGMTEGRRNDAGGAAQE